MPNVDHVRDREVANVHVIVIREETGSGGGAFIIDVIGQGIFEGLDFSTIFNASANASDAEERDGFLRTIEAALVYRTLPSLFPLRLVHNQISLRV
jgi:hypothetical protein